MDSHKTASKADSATTGDVTPLVIDLGKKRRKQIKALRKGEGRLMGQIMDAVSDLKEAGHVAKSAQPIVVVVKQGGKKDSLGWGYWD